MCGARPRFGRKSAALTRDPASGRRLREGENAMTISRFAAAALVLFFIGAAHAQQAPQVAVRGTIEAVADNGTNFSVRTRSGEAATVRLTPATSVTLVVPAALADVKPGSFIGVAALPGAEGLQNAQFDANREPR